MLAAAELGWSLRASDWLWLLCLGPLLWWWRARRRACVPFAAGGLLRGDLARRHDAAALPRSFRQRLVALPDALVLLGFLCFVLAMARPVQRLPLPPERLGLDVLLCLDTSSSMAADDLAPGRTRLAVAKEVAAAFVQGRADDRTGFLQFARYADLRCPPTLDHAAVADLLAEVDMVAKDGPEDATGIGGAVARAADVLQRSTARSKVVILLTDGEENVATTATPQEIAPLHAAQLCAQMGVRVHGIVVGQGHRKPDGGFLPLDTTAVRQLAATTGGRFFAARDAAALEAVYRDIDALERVAFAEPRTLLREWFPLAVALGLLWTVLGRWLHRGWLEVQP